MDTQVFIQFVELPFRSLWLTSGCTQNLFLLFVVVLSRRALTATDSTKSTPHTLTDSEENVRTLRFFYRPWAQPTNTRPLRLFHRCGKKPLVCASPYVIAILARTCSNCVRARMHLQTIATDVIYYERSKQLVLSVWCQGWYKKPTRVLTAFCNRFW